MAGVIFNHGTDADFTHELGKDCTYSEDSKTYRIISRMELLVDDKRKYFVLKAVDPKNPVQQFELPIADKDKLTVIDCVAAIDSVWDNVTFNGRMDATMNYIRNSVFSRCDVKDRKVTFSVDGDVFKMDFDGVKTYEKAKT